MMPPDSAAAPRSRRRMPVPLPSPWFWGFVVLYVLLGLVGHDPWKTSDAIGFGIAWTMVNGGGADWVLPNVAGVLVAEEGPLAFWLAALLIKLLSGVLYAQDAARLSAGLWTMLAIYAVYRAARAQFGEAEGRLAVLILLACLGLLARSHETAAEPALVAACALLLWVLAAASAATTLAAPSATSSAATPGVASLATAFTPAATPSSALAATPSALEFRLALSIGGVILTF